MANLDIYVEVINDQTVSDIGSGKVKVDKKVNFHNRDSVGELVVTIESKDAQGRTALCKNNSNGPADAIIHVPSAGHSPKYAICDSYSLNYFKYSAEIAPAEKEDPIIIIDRAMSYSSVALELAIGAVVVAFTLGFFFARMFSKFKPATRS